MPYIVKCSLIGPCYKAGKRNVTFLCITGRLQDLRIAAKIGLSTSNSKVSSISTFFIFRAKGELVSYIWMPLWFCATFNTCSKLHCLLILRSHLTQNTTFDFIMHRTGNLELLDICRKHGNSGVTHSLTHLHKGTNKVDDNV